jgi:hypothetical protein
MSVWDDIERLYAVATIAARSEGMTTKLRIDFINHSTFDVTIEVKTSETIVYRELLTSTPANLPDDKQGHEYHSGSHALVVPAGRFFGFMTSSPVTISNPSPQLVQVISASGKDPWPQPPPPPPSSLSGMADYPMRYKNFNTVEALPGKYRPVPFALAPLPAP